LVIHLSPSAAPATNQSNSSLLSQADEQPPSITHFGQGPLFTVFRSFIEKASVDADSSLIDFVEPYQPAEGPQTDPAPGPDAAKARPLPAIGDPGVDAALDFTDGRLLDRSLDGQLSQPDDQLRKAATTWSLSVAFGVAAVATGGYHLVMREADRFKGKWVPRWAGAERPTKRKFGIPSR
jgi:hypothetical protein